MQVFTTQSLNKSERAQILKEYALSVSAGETQKAKDIKNNNSKWISQAEFAAAS